MTYTYFIVNDHNALVKIGKTTNPTKRINQIKGSTFLNLSFFHLIEGDYENKLHKHYQQYRRNGEWFDIPGLTVDLINEAVSTFKPTKQRIKIDSTHIINQSTLVLYAQDNKKVLNMAKNNRLIKQELKNLKVGQSLRVVEEIINTEFPFKRSIFLPRKQNAPIKKSLTIKNN